MTTTTETNMEEKNKSKELDATVSTPNIASSAKGVTESVAASSDVATVAIPGITGGVPSSAVADNTARRARPQRPRRARNNRGERARSEFDQMTIDVRRVARVVAGGRRFSFSVTVVIGDHKGRVGVGLGKGTDTALAIEKANRDARRHMIHISRTKTGSILHEVSAKYTSSCITIAPSPGRGIVAGSAMRVVIELSGVTDVVGKILSRSKNKLTITRATIQAFASLEDKRTAVNNTKSTPKQPESSDNAQ